MSMQPTLDWIFQQQEEMTTLVEEWASLNTGTFHVRGLAAMIATLKESFASLGGNQTEISLKARRAVGLQKEEPIPLGTALHIVKHPQAPTRVFLGGHMDTVFPADSPFQKTERKPEGILGGPGVADMKGGLVILLKALEALERSPYAGRIGWEVLINPDEEIGSPGSSPLFAPIARRNSVGLLFEPAFNDGALVSQRKGSANMRVFAKGRAAHAGRDFFEGRNALTALARFVVQAEQLIDQKQGITLNVGHLHGGIAANVVPDQALTILNLRAEKEEDLNQCLEKLRLFAKEAKRQEIELEIHVESSAPPKPFDSPIQTLFEAFQECARELNLNLAYRPSGGVCDGNRLYAEGLPNLDTLGAVGGHIHSPNEYILIQSLPERAALSALFLLHLAAGDIKLPNKGTHRAS